MTIQERIAELKYNPFGADQQAQAQAIVNLHLELFPDSDLCRTCRAGIMQMFNQLKQYQPPQLPMEQPTHKYRFAPGIEPFRPFFGDPRVFSNENLTDEIAEQIIAESPNMLRDNVILVNEDFVPEAPAPTEPEAPAPGLDEDEEPEITEANAPKSPRRKRNS